MPAGEAEEMRCMWRREGEAEIVAEPTEEEYVLLPHMTHDTALEVAKIKAKEKKADVERPGRIYMHDDCVEADPPVPRMARELEEFRVAVGKDPHEPVAWGDIEEVARRRSF